MGELRRPGLRLVVPGRADELGGADGVAVQPGHEQHSLGHQQHAAEVARQGLAPLGVQPAEAAALDDGRVRRLAEVREVGLGQRVHALDEQGVGGLDHGAQRRKFRRIRSPTGPDFSAWNWVPARLSRPTTAATSPP